MLVLNIGSLKKKNHDWVILETSDGNVYITAKYDGGKIQLVLDAPKKVNIKRKNYENNKRDN